ncbi:MAG: hypothetical protein EOQ28_14855 [Mesorhizobium sp.]|uniref:hypothetical protein n=1 Tax=Mesorhizobium sp. TaxID=1871066 RepID=UPI000FE89095|nr:hypothetical protein [Mesorhizobium sp.]RWA73420.1 MAG: hypothetical protein EOQ28_14855 [Mesorhizobium sp.]
MTALPFDQIDVVLSENLKSVLLYGYASDQIYLQNVHHSDTELDPGIVEVAEANHWRGKADPNAWVKL